MRLRLWMKAKLREKDININGKVKHIYGLASFGTHPTHKGIGRFALKAFEYIAKQDKKYCIIGFCDDKEVLQFYLKCGWHFIGEYHGKYATGNKSIKNIQFSEVW